MKQERKYKQEKVERETLNDIVTLFFLFIIFKKSYGKITYQAKRTTKMKEHIDWCEDCQEREDRINHLQQLHQTEKINKEIMELCRESELCIVNHLNFYVD